MGQTTIENVFESIFASPAKIKRRRTITYISYISISMINVSRGTPRKRTLKVDSFDSSLPLVAFPDQVGEILACNVRFPLDLANIFLLLLQFLNTSLQVDIELLSWETQNPSYFRRDSISIR